MKCKICNSESKPVFSHTVLEKYSVTYFQCTKCHFIETEQPYWLQEAYSNAITNLDLGLVYRNMMFAPKTDLIIQLFFNADGKFLDYGGGYGLMVRMMRDKGYNFYRQDNYCENLFAKNFDIEVMPEDFKKDFELVSAFEVFEHLENPLENISRIAGYSKNILFSTEVLPHNKVTPENWWYFAPETGQHISIYSEQSLRAIAGILNIHYYKISNGLHLFSEKVININRLFKIEKSRLNRWWYYKFNYTHKDSLLFSDINKIAGRSLFKL